MWTQRGASAADGCGAASAVDVVAAVVVFVSGMCEGAPECSVAGLDCHRTPPFPRTICTGLLPETGVDVAPFRAHAEDVAAVGEADACLREQVVVDVSDGRPAIVRRCLEDGPVSDG